ncbi:MAG: hypothetical protein H6907_17595 [Hyphomicrobiales bacterium]|nr:hypothetical protein [Hyphomicrobiales bacterium]
MAGLDLTGADLHAHGSSLIVTLADGVVIVVHGYFAGPDLPLPAALAQPGGKVLHLAAQAFDTFVAAVEGTGGREPAAEPGAGTEGENLDAFETAAGGGEDAAVLARLMQQDPELARLLVDAGLGRLIAAVGDIAKFVPPPVTLDSTLVAYATDGSDVLVDSVGGTNALLTQPQWTLFSSYYEPPADSGGGETAYDIYIPPPPDLINQTVFGLLYYSYGQVVAKAGTGTLQFTGQTGNDFDRTGDGLPDRDFVQFLDPHNFFHQFYGAYSFKTLSIDGAHEIRFLVDGNVYVPGATNGYFTPQAPQTLQYNIVQATNISQFGLVGDSGDGTFAGAQAAGAHYALPGAGNPDMLYLYLGKRDIDTLSFYDPADPAGGNGDYDFVTPFTVTRANSPATEADNTTETIAPYSRIGGVDIVDARGFGTNGVVLNKAAVVAMTEARDFGGVDVWGLELAGDGVDGVTLLDESQWRYNGRIDAAAQTVAYGNGQSYVVDSTVARFGNVQYQFVHLDGDAFVNVSASFGAHPRWYWTDGTDGDDTLALPDTQFGNVAFGGGMDTLVMDAYAWTGAAYEYSTDFDFTGTGGGISGLEVITTADGAGADTVTVDHAFVTAATDAANTLTLLGDAADRALVSDLATNWTFDGQSGGFARYVNGADGAVLKVQTELAQDLGLYLNGWGGDDTFDVADLGAFDGLDGSRDGSTTDTDALALTGAGNADLHAAAGRLANLEVLDLSGNGAANTASFDVADLVAVTDSDNALLVLGDAGDAIDLLDPSHWTYAGYQAAGGLNLLASALGGKDVLVSAAAGLAIPRLSVAATGGDDTFTLAFGDVADVDGGAGFDRLVLAMGGAEDFTAGGLLAAIEEIDAGNGAANALVVGADQVTQAVDRTLRVLGDAADSLTFAGGETWTAGTDVEVDGQTFASYSTTAGDGDMVTVLVQPGLV